MPNLAILTNIIGQVKNGVYDTDALQDLCSSYSESVTVCDMVHQYGIELFWCDSCRKLEFIGKARSAYGNLQRICTKCVKLYVVCKECNSLAIANDPLHYHVPDLLDHMEEMKLMKWDAKVGNYCSGELVSDNSMNPRLLGVEVEVNLNTDQPRPPDIALKAKRLLPPKTCIVIRDGSLKSSPMANGVKGTDGFELVTIPADLPAHLNGFDWPRWMDVMGRFADTSSDDAAVHIHISTESMTPITIARATRFFNDSLNRTFLNHIAQRQFGYPSKNSQNNGKVYAQTFPPDAKVRELITHRSHGLTCPNNPINIDSVAFYGKEKKLCEFGHFVIENIRPERRVYLCHCQPGCYSYPEKWINGAQSQIAHYAAFNVNTGGPHVEIRIFKTTFQSLHFLACLEFSHAVFSYCADTRMNDIGYHSFCDWLMNTKHPRRDGKGTKHIYYELMCWLDGVYITMPRNVRGKDK